jgi:hypothetical protein
MGILVLILLGIGLMYVMSRGHGGMGCCGGGHGDHQPKGHEDMHSANSSLDRTPDVIDLRDDEYTVLSDEDEDLLRKRRGNSVEENRLHSSSA